MSALDQDRAGGLSGPMLPVVRDPLADAIGYAGLHPNTLLNLGEGFNVWSDAVVVSSGPWDDSARLRYHVFVLSGNDVPHLLKRSLEFDPTRWVRLDVCGKADAIRALAALKPTSIDLGEIDKNHDAPKSAGEEIRRLFRGVERVDLSSVYNLYENITFLKDALSEVPSFKEIRHSSTEDWQGAHQLWGDALGMEDAIDAQQAEVEAWRTANACITALSNRIQPEMIRGHLKSVTSRPFNCVPTKLYVGCVKHSLEELDPTGDSQYEDDFVDAFQQIDTLNRQPMAREFADFWKTLSGILLKKNCSATVAGVTSSAQDAAVAAAVLRRTQSAFLNAAKSFTGAATFVEVEGRLPLLRDPSIRPGVFYDRVHCLCRLLYASLDTSIHGSFRYRLNFEEWVTVAKLLRPGETLESLPEEQFLRDDVNANVSVFHCCEYALSIHSYMDPFDRELLLDMLELLALHGTTEKKLCPQDDPREYTWRQFAEWALSTKKVYPSSDDGYYEDEEEDEWSDSEPEDEMQMPNAAVGNRWGRVGYAIPRGATIAIDGAEMTRLEICSKALALGATDCRAWLGIGSELAGPGRENEALVEIDGNSLSAEDCFVRAAGVDPSCEEAWCYLGAHLKPGGKVVINGVRHTQADCVERGRNAILNWHAAVRK